MGFGLRLGPGAGLCRALVKSKYLTVSKLSIESVKTWSGFRVRLGQVRASVRVRVRVRVRVGVGARVRVQVKTCAAAFSA